VLSVGPWLLPTAFFVFFAAAAWARIVSTDLGGRANKWSHLVMVAMMVAVIAARAMHVWLGVRRSRLMAVFRAIRGFWLIAHKYYPFYFYIS
jgi:hypothetical protein